MGDIFVAPVYACQAQWWRLTTPGQVSCGAAPPTGVFPVWVAAAPGPVTVPKAPEAAGDFRVNADIIFIFTKPGFLTMVRAFPFYKTHILHWD